MNDEFFLREAIALAQKGMRSGKGGPFGAVIVREGRIIGQGNNQVLSSHDPTAHAEMVAIRDACRTLGHHQLEGCTVYSSCEPCPMCLGALYWARPERIVFASDRHTAAMAGFDDKLIYEELTLPVTKRKILTMRVDLPEAGQVFRDWEDLEDKVPY